ncbi:hypothetical protein [Helicobacter japonicus]|uniref:hypothetical protein n=1 Tax=Helicobacter japonicus TaxID=425400 RepID=UPI00259682FA|nr:hypothetical protein [Helicobacter japonicus]
MKRIIFIILVLVLAVQSKADELISGGFAKLGLNYAYLTHSAGKSRTESVHMALFVDYYYIFENGFGLGFDTSLGASTGNTNGYYPLQEAESLTSTKPFQTQSFLQTQNIRVGYYFVRRTYDKPLYIGTGLNIEQYSNSSTNTPAIGMTVGNYIPIELRGDIRVNPRFMFEYLFAYDIGVAQGLTILYDEDNKTKVSAKNGYGLRLNLGGRYYVSKKVSFYANILASYHSFGASESATISIIQPPAGTTITPGYKPGSAVVSYPRSSISYVGLQIGIGY